MSALFPITVEKLKQYYLEKTPNERKEIQKNCEDTLKNNSREVSSDSYQNPVKGLEALHQIRGEVL